MVENAVSRNVVVLNRTEWLILCSEGRIRLNRRRLVPSQEIPTAREMHRAFALAPHTRTESAIDVFILEVSDEWERIAAKHRAAAPDVRVLNLDDVVAHRAASREHHAYYSGEARKFGVELAEPEFEKHWIDWCTHELVSGGTLGASRLIGALGNTFDYEKPRADRYQWHDVGRVVLRPSYVARPKPGHVDQLIRSWLDIADQVAGTRDLQTFHIAVLIVWVELRTKKDVQLHRRHANSIQQFLDTARTEPFGSPTNSTQEAFAYFESNFQRAFTQELTPLVVSGVLECLLTHRSGDLTPDRAYRILIDLASNHAGQALVAFVMSVNIGLGKTVQLSRAVGLNNWTSPTWIE